MNEVCPLCNDTGVEVVPGKGARPCSCRVSVDSSRRLQLARVPKRYQLCSLDNFKTTPNSPLQMPFQYACRFVLDYPSERGILFTGPSGVGKTHLAVAILNRLIEKGVQGMFYEFGALMKEIQDSYNPETQVTELSVLSPVYTAQVLVLDELGASVPTEWVRDTMYQIINRRYNDKRPTIFTSNYSDNPGATPKDKTLQDRIGPRLRSRLYEMCHHIEVSGEDYRKRFNHRGLEKV